MRHQPDRFVSHLLPLFVVLVFVFIATSKLYNNYFYTSHDGEGHVIRMLEFHEAFKDGQIPVRLAKRINYGLGFPFFNFNYPLVYYLGELIHRLGLDIVSTYKAILILSVLISAIFFYAFCRSYFKILSSLIAAIFFIFFPYKFLNLYVRGNPAEALGLAILAFNFWVFDQYLHDKGNGYLIVISLAALILSHNITFLIGVLFLSFFIIYSWFNLNIKVKKIKKIFYQVIVALLLTTFFWLPVVVESNLTKLSEIKEDYQTFFPTFREIIYSPWGFGAYKQGISPGKMSPQIGLAAIFVILLSFFKFIMKLVKIKPDKQDKLLVFFLGSILVFIFFSLPISKHFWSLLPLLKYVQLPWRFIGFISFGSAYAAGYLVNNIKNNLSFFISFFLIVLVLYTNRNHIRVNQFVAFNNPFVNSLIYGPSTTSKDEQMPKWAPRVYSEQNPDGDLFPSDAGKSKREIWKSNLHIFRLTLDNSADFRDNTSYFPGWSAYLDEKKVSINYKSDQFGRLFIAVPKGEHEVKFKFQETWYRFTANLISLLTFLAFVIKVIMTKIVIKSRVRYNKI